MTPFSDKAGWEQIKRQGDAAIKRWIDEQTRLVGDGGLDRRGDSQRRWAGTRSSRVSPLKGLLGVYIAGIENQRTQTEDLGPSPLPAGNKTQLWNKSDGAANLPCWVEAALA